MTVCLAQVSWRFFFITMWLTQVDWVFVLRCAATIQLRSPPGEEICCARCFDSFGSYLHRRQAPACWPYPIASRVQRYHLCMWVLGVGPHHLLARCRLTRGLGLVSAVANISMNIVGQRESIRALTICRWMIDRTRRIHTELLMKVTSMRVEYRLMIFAPLKLLI